MVGGDLMRVCGRGRDEEYRSNVFFFSFFDELHDHDIRKACGLAGFWNRGGRGILVVDWCFGNFTLFGWALAVMDWDIG